MFVEETEGVEPFQKIKLVKLKPNTDINGILRYLSVKEKIENVRRGQKAWKSRPGPGLAPISEKIPAVNYRHLNS